LCNKDTYIGDEALRKRGLNLSLYFPNIYYSGSIKNFEFLEKIWHHTFYNELKISPEDHSIILTENSFNTKQNKEKMEQIIFETFNIPELFI
jgi:actin-related protein